MLARAEAAEATRARVLAAAHQQFAELPFEQVSLELVARQAGVTVQTVLRRFQSKSGLFAEVAAWRAASIKTERDAVVAGDVDGAIRTLVESYERWGDEVLHLLVEEHRSPAIRQVTESGRRYHHAWVRRVFGPNLADLQPADLDRRLAQLVVITDLYAWKILRRDLDLTPHEAQATLWDLVTRVLSH
jgi:AcrR family transcriptional regulator